MPESPDLCDLRELIVWYPSATGSQKLDPPAEVLSRLPRLYLEFLETFGPGEGFLSGSYLRLYPLDELMALNEAYEFPVYSPGLFLFGSNGGGEAFAFNLGADPLGVVQIPFIPLDNEFVEPVSGDFGGFLLVLAQVPPDPTDGLPPEANLDAIGKEVHQRQPLILGGSPGPENQVLVPTLDHAKLCRFWNKVVKRIREQQRGGV